MTAMLRLNKIERTLGKFQLGPIDLELAPGMGLGFIGPNGAGKSTTIHCLLGLRRPSGGTVEISGVRADVSAGDWKKQVGFVLNQQGFYERQSVAANLRFIASFYADWDQAFSDTLLRRLQLDADKKVKSLSTGDRVKLALVGALSHRPRLLVMDEPTSGLDPLVRAELIDVLAELMRTGDHSLFISTHILADVAALADQLAFINAGKLVSVVDKDQLEERWRRISFRAAQPLAAVPGAVKAEMDGGLHMVTTSDGDAALAYIKGEQAAVLATNRLTLDEIAVHILQRARA